MKQTLKSISIQSNQAKTIITKRTIVSLVAFATMFLVGAAPNARARDCSNASLQGAYGFTLGAIVAPGIPRGVLGRLVFDGRGNLTATITVNNNGTVTHINDVGTYTVDADCTGKLFTKAVPGTVEIVLVDGGKEFYQLRTDPAAIVVLSNVAKKQLPGDNE